MRPSDFITDVDPQSLQVENDLLRHEVAYLRGRLNYLDDQLKKAKTDVKRDRRVRHTEKELAEAVKDLKWILRKLDGPPAGWVLRRRSGFRRLWARWVEPGDTE